VDKSTNLTITFSEHVQAGTGNILLTPDGGNGPHSPMAVDVTSGNVLFEGTSMSVDPPSDLTDTGEKNYTITFESGVVKDVSGNMYPGISGSTYTVLVADSTPPVVAAYYPVQNATDQPKSRSIVLTFSEDMIIGTGSIVITPSGGNGPDPVLYINVQSSQVSVSGTQVTIDPTDDLIDTGGKTHTVTFATGVLKDVKGNSFAGLFGDTYHFSVDDSTIPKLLSVTPVHGAVNQAKDSNIMLEFSEYVTAGVGKILLTPSGGNQANDQLSIWVNDSSQVTFNQRYATINPSNDLVDTGGKTYAVSMADGVIQGMGLNGFPGLNATAYTFAVTDSTPPAIVSYYPAANAELQSKATDIHITFNEDITAGSGNLVLTPSGGTGPNPVIQVDVASSQISFAGMTMIVNPVSALANEGNKTITVTMAAGVVRDVRGNALGGLSGQSYQFGVAHAVVPDIPMGLALTVVSQNRIRLDWSLPFNGYSPLSNYTVFTWRERCGLDTCAAGLDGTWDKGISVDGGALTAGSALQPHSGTRTTVEMGNVPVHQTYKFKLQAHNDVGAGLASAEVVATLKVCSQVEIVNGTETWSCLV